MINNGKKPRRKRSHSVSEEDSSSSGTNLACAQCGKYIKCRLSGVKKETWP